MLRDKALLSWTGHQEPASIISHRLEHTLLSLVRAPLAVHAGRFGCRALRREHDRRTGTTRSRVSLESEQPQSAKRDSAPPGHLQIRVRHGHPMNHLILEIANIMCKMLQVQGEHGTYCFKSIEHSTGVG